MVLEVKGQHQGSSQAEKQSAMRREETVPERGEKSQ